MSIQTNHRQFKFTFCSVHLFVCHLCFPHIDGAITKILKKKKKSENVHFFLINDHVLFNRLNDASNIDESSLVKPLIAPIKILKDIFFEVVRCFRNAG